MHAGLNAMRSTWCVIVVLLLNAGLASTAVAEPTFPPSLPQGRASVTDRTEAFLSPPSTLREDVVVATTPPTVDFLFYPGQDYAGQPWSNWGEGTAANLVHPGDSGDAPVQQGRLMREVGSDSHGPI